MDRVRVLVTGAAGPNFLRSAVSQLAKEHSVVGLDRSVVPELSEPVDWMTGDVSDRALVSSAMQDVDVVVHGAVATGDGTYTSAEVPFRTNVSVYNVFDCARLHLSGASSC
jgi:nucleoside-diphosphate-sugar epimerase